MLPAPPALPQALEKINIQFGAVEEERVGECKMSVALATQTSHHYPQTRGHISRRWMDITGAQRSSLPPFIWNTIWLIYLRGTTRLAYLKVTTHK